MELSSIKEKYLGKAFKITLILKGLNALIEIISGVAILFISKDLVVRVVVFLTRGELIEDPKSFGAHYLLGVAQYISPSSLHFAALYFFSHGVIKMVLIVGLLRQKLWMYPVSIFVFCLFIIYQMHRYIFTHSIWLIIFTLFDSVIVLLTIHEYNYIKKSRMVQADSTLKHS